MDKDLGSIVEDGYLDDCTVDDIRDSLPEHQPRYLVMYIQCDSMNIRLKKQRRFSR